MELTREQKGILFRESVIAFEHVIENCECVNDKKDFSGILTDDEFVNAELNLTIYADNGRRMYHNVKPKLENENEIRFYLVTKYEEIDTEEKFESSSIYEIKDKINELNSKANQDIAKFNENNFKLYYIHEVMYDLYDDIEAFINSRNLDINFIKINDDDSNQIFIVIKDKNDEYNKMIRVWTHSDFTGNPIFVASIYNQETAHEKWYDCPIDDYSEILNAIKEELKNYNYYKSRNYTDYTDDEDEEDYDNLF